MKTVLQIQLEAKGEALTHLHNARVTLGAAGFHEMAREVASLTNQVMSAKADGTPVHPIYDGETIDAMQKLLDALEEARKAGKEDEFREMLKKYRSDAK